MLIRKNTEWTQILLCQGTNSHGISKKHPNRIVYNWKYHSWLAIGSVAFLTMDFSAIAVQTGWGARNAAGPGGAQAAPGDHLGHAEP